MRIRNIDKRYLFLTGFFEFSNTLECDTYALGEPINESLINCS